MPPPVPPNLGHNGHRATRVDCTVYVRDNRVTILVNTYIGRFRINDYHLWVMDGNRNRVAIGFIVPYLPPHLRVAEWQCQCGRGADCCYQRRN